jgi:outer membrane beta-barrel protein
MCRRLSDHNAALIALMVVAAGAASPAWSQEEPPAEAPPATDASEFTLEDLEQVKAVEEAAAAEEPAAEEGDLVKTATDEGIDLTLQDRIKAVARKTFVKTGRFELQPSMMVTVNDAFFRSFAAAGRVSWHLNEAFALEVGGAYIPPFFVQKLEPVDLLREQLALINADNKVFALADVGLTFSPLYGKVAVLGDGIIQFDGFLSAGVGATFDNGADLVHPTMDIGAGARVFLTRWLVVRGDIRDYVYPQEKAGISTLQNLLFVSVGLGFYFPLDFEYQFEAARVNKNG